MSKKDKKEESLCGQVVFNVNIICKGKKKCKCKDKKDHDKDCKKHDDKKCDDDKKIEQINITGITKGDIQNLAK